MVWEFFVILPPEKWPSGRRQRTRNAPNGHKPVSGVRIPSSPRNAIQRPMPHASAAFVVREGDCPKACFRAVSFSYNKRVAPPRTGPWIALGHPGMSEAFGRRNPFQLILRREILLLDTAKRANPIRRDILESRSRGDAAIRITNCRVIHIPANVTYVFLHKCNV